jgi:hypothetical protein
MSLKVDIQEGLDLSDDSVTVCLIPLDAQFKKSRNQHKVDGHN